MSLMSVEKLEQYIEQLRSHPVEVKALVRDLLISVTSFFREPDHFDFVHSTIQGWRNAGQQRFRIWSAACSTAGW